MKQEEFNMSVLHDTLHEIFDKGGHYTIPQLVELLGSEYTELEIENALGEMNGELDVTTMWYVNDDREEFEKFDNFNQIHYTN